MNSDILFFASYPIKKINEGMAQRILQIDEKLLDKKRVYVHCSMKFIGSLRIVQVADNIVQVYCNPLLSYRTLRRLMNSSSIIYFHSIYNYIHAALLPLANRRAVLDIHGIVPEENEFAGNYFKSKIYSRAEKSLFRKLTFAICVSDKMKDFFCTKYPRYANRIKFLTLPIVQEKSELSFPDPLALAEDDVVFIYSGGLQKWQNIHLMLASIVKLISKKYVFLFLTQHPEELKKIVREYPLKDHRIIIRSATKQELPYYYSLSHYGFLLRDKHLLNSVSSPTKMFEYLEGGITPVLLTEDIGDYDKMVYDKISIKDLHNSLPAVKRTRNKEVVEDLRQKASLDLWSILYSS